MSTYNSDFAHGIVFHHFLSEKHNFGQGAITGEEFENILLYVGIDRIINSDDWINKSLKGVLSSNDICITFDDTLLSQYEVALPILEKYKIRAFFFINTGVLIGELQAVEIFRKFYSVYFDSFDHFFISFYNQIVKEYSLKFIEKSLNNFIPENEYLDCPFYTRNDKTFRYLRDKILGEEEYNLLMYSMIKNYNIDLNLFSKDIWISPKQIKKMFSEGHTIGLHSHSHPMLMGHLSEKDQLADYKKNIFNLEKIIGEKPISMSHPANSYNKKTLKILKDLDISIGFRAKMDKLDYSLLEHPREDHSNILKTIQK